MYTTSKCMSTEPTPVCVPTYSRWVSSMLSMGLGLLAWMNGRQERERTGKWEWERVQRRWQKIFETPPSQSRLWNAMALPLFLPLLFSSHLCIINPMNQFPIRDIRSRYYIHCRWSLMLTMLLLFFFRRYIWYEHYWHKPRQDLRHERLVLFGTLERHYRLFGWGNPR